MPKIMIDSDECYPYYWVDVGSGVEVEVTHDELKWIKTRLEQRDELHTFLSDKEDEVQARLAEARKLEEVRKAAEIAKLPVHFKALGRIVCGSKDAPRQTWNPRQVTCKDCLTAIVGKPTDEEVTC